MKYKLQGLKLLKKVHLPKLRVLKTAAAGDEASLFFLRTSYDEDKIFLQNSALLSGRRLRKRFYSVGFKQGLKNYSEQRALRYE